MDEYITLPFGLTFEVWVNMLINTFPNDNIPIPPPEKFWWGWAEYLLSLPRFLVAPVPDKKMYPNDDSWRDWALLLIQTLNQ